jgi:hypothetical protein
MNKLIDRRKVLAVALAGLLGSCSRPSATVNFTVETGALDAVRATVRSFAACHDYTPAQVIGGDPNGLYFAGRLSRFEFFSERHMAPGAFTARFIDNRPFPQDDIYARLSDFIALMRPIEGVFIPEGYE